MLFRSDELTGFVTPVWPQLSDMPREKYTPVFDYSIDISPELNTDIGQLKALVLTRGEKIGNYRDVTGVSADKYNNGAGMLPPENSVSLPAIPSITGKETQVTFPFVADVSAWIEG